MAETEVGFLLMNLQKLQQELKLRHQVKDQIENLENNLHLFKAFLRDSTKKRLNHSRVPEVISQIHDFVDEAQDAIGNFGVKAAKLKSQNWFIRAFKKPVNLHGGITTQVESVGGKVRAIYADQNVLDMATLNIIEDGAPPRVSVPQIQAIREDIFVGLEDETYGIIGYLMEEREKLDVISIIGMAGLGKTTLAAKIFNSVQIQYHFLNRFWVSISHKFNLRDVLLQILRRITDQEFSGNTDEDLAQAVRAYLEGRQFLLVIDDVWRIKDWNDIRKFLPKENILGKVLITSQDRNVGIHANPTRKPFNMRFLTTEESWQLLQYKVFGKPNSFPADLEDIGRSIARKCDGMPLSLVSVGGVISASCSKSKGMMSEMDLVLKKMYEEVGGSISQYGGIELSYDRLPEELRNCFLYLGVFPKDYRISVFTLTNLWIAEGFIQDKEGKSLEEIAEDNLNDLINRNLIFVDRISMSGKVKTCHVLDVVHEFCNFKVGNMEQNLFQEIKRSDYDVFDSPISKVKKYRRLCIHSDLPKLLSKKNLVGPGVRSLLSFSKESYDVPPNYTSIVTDSLNSLRVLEFKPYQFHEFPQNICKLIHLRYITLSIQNPKFLPDSISELWNLQTLLIYTMSRTLEIKANIWKLIQLKHLKTNAAIILAVKGKADGACENLQTLARLLPKYCTEEVLNKARNIKKLGIRGRLATLLEGNYYLAALDCLENLKMMNDVFPKSASEDRLPSLPPPSQFPPKLKSLTLSNTFLEWSHMSILGLLENLEVLKLKDNAFWGHSWEALDGGFPHLEALYIGRTNLIFWRASPHHYPRLKCLELHCCEELIEVPIGLADILSFQRLDLYRSNGAANSASKIREVKQQRWREQNITHGEFKLSIFPPLH